VEPSRKTENTALSTDGADQRYAKLLVLEELATAAGIEPIAGEARALAKRVAEKRFFVACVGQFKRGKSTLLNALVGSPVLPTGVVPVTTTVTILRYGAVPRAVVYLRNNVRYERAVSSVADYVSEELNPGNRKNVAAVEIFLPSSLLTSGMCLVDTPGIGSVFAGNTAVTREFVPHIDAALVVIGADPPISGEELGLIEDVSRQVSDIVFVLNKADRLTERDGDEAAAFAERTLVKRIGWPAGRLFRVSAYEWLNATKGSGPSRDEAVLRDALDKLARESGAKLVRAAEERGLKRLSIALLRELDSIRDALLRPVQDSRHLVDRLTETIADAERSLNDLGYLFKGEQERVSSKCADQREVFLSEALPAALKEFRDSIRQTELHGSALRQKAIALAQETSRKWLDRWLIEERPAAEKMYRQSAERFVQMANDFLERLAASGDAALADLPLRITAEMGFTKESRLYYGDLFAFPHTTILGWLQGLLLMRQQQLAAIESQVARYLNTLLTINSTRILNDLDERIRDSARRLEAQIRSQLKEIREGARHTLERAVHKQTEGIEAVQKELERMESLRQQLLILQADASTTSTNRTRNGAGF